ncbi:MAG: hypothetical protein A2664_04590 [Candidatus Taylorbacteria bacterium RIFCSPHIGHO2_01_FULL_46_22b]|uniref:DNA replication/recombination mediator RecO N-terminal domain-containing protein n=1 Tax=Candidatus Taylorbacteria bacterium RIFCSPHIGHO2_01_FULL_46_22b TaxID=1802301 RepID=A0A1G2M4B7_9BACT|nr:MAG: hypothetical protein A2664_04590 [Candidatus Taylorbacteria bacterium RIFCSPHIGHO2_01_FULL_46_22b]
MHHIYETDAVVLSATPSGESDRQLTLFSREFGLIRVTAQGIRHLKSKLRYSVQPYSLVKVNLVQGRGGWRLTNAELSLNFFSLLCFDAPRSRILGNIFLLIRRLVQGEERNCALFDTLVAGLRFLVTTPAVSLPTTELVIVLRVLYNLGYIGATAPLSSDLLTGAWTSTVLMEAETHRGLFLRSINESLGASHL